MKPWPFTLSRRWLVALPLAALLLNAGCAALDEQQRRWIFQPSKVSWGGGAGAEGLAEVWIDYQPADASSPVRLNGLWLPQPRADAPTLLYLHGARWDVRSSTHRMRRMHTLGFAVLGVDYRGFGQSTDALPSEMSALQDAQAAWAWLGRRQPQAARYLYGHSLGSTIAVRLAAESAPADTPAGLVLEGAFTSIPDLVGTFQFGWLPLGPLISQRFDAGARIGQLQMPLLMVHGTADRLVPPALGRALFDLAAAPKRFVLVEGGSHHGASGTGLPEVRAAVQALFGLPGGGAE
jgi:alpha-beta hydrolase superfamily lysophospholipase